MAEKTYKYEGMFLLNNSGYTETEGGAVGLVTAMLQKCGTEPIRAEVWDERKLTYTIDKQKRGTYVLTYFETEPAVVETITRNVNISEPIMRVLVIRHEKEFPPFPQVNRDALRPPPEAQSEAGSTAGSRPERDARPGPHAGAGPEESYEDVNDDATGDREGGES